MTTTFQHPHLASLAEELDLTLEQIRTMQASLTPEQLAWKPDPKRWSILECIDHVRITNAGYLPRLRDAITEASSDGAERPFKPTWFGKWFLSLVAPEVKRKLKAPSGFTSAGNAGNASGPDLAVIDKVLEQGETLHNLLIAADEVNINATKFASPLTRFVRFTIGEGLTLTIWHTDRHIQQAERVTQEAAFPSS